MPVKPPKPDLSEVVDQVVANLKAAVADGAPSAACHWAKLLAALEARS